MTEKKNSEKRICTALKGKSMSENNGCEKILERENNGCEKILEREKELGDSGVSH